MRMNFSFTVTARLVVMNNIAEKLETTDIELEFDITRAETFLFRFNNGELLIDEYVILFRYDESGRIKGIYAKKDKDLYLISNSNQLVEEVIKGYQYLINMDKLSDILEFDFKKAIDAQDLADIEEEE